MQEEKHKKRGPAQYRKRKLSGSGFVILFAVTISAILLAMALGASNIAFREIKFSTNAVGSNNALFAADTAIECALYYDHPSHTIFSDVPTAPSMNCAGFSITPTESLSSFWTFAIGDLGDNGQGCATVTVDKGSTVPPPLTTIFVSKGYNNGYVNGDVCAHSNNNTIERELDVSY